MDRTAESGKAARLWHHLIGCFLLSESKFVVCHLGSSVVVAQHAVARPQGQMSDLIKSEAPRTILNIASSRKTFRQLVCRVEVNRESLDRVS